MSTSFRLRVDLPPEHRIDIASEHHELTLDGFPAPLIISGRPTGTPIKESAHIAIRSDGWPDEPSARAAAERFEHVLMLALANQGVGADFGRRAFPGVVTEFGLEMLRREHGRTVHNDTHGVSVFPTETPPPLFVFMELTTRIGHAGDSFLSAIRESHAGGRRLSTAGRLAFDLFSASFIVEALPDARFVLLVQAVEALIDQPLRRPEAVAHVDELVRLTKANASLQPVERQTMISSLQWIRRESIGASGRALAGTLAPKQYADMAASEFFTKCYNTRSKLTHGALDRPGVQEVGILCAHLQQMVADLLVREPAIEQTAATTGA